MAPYRFGFVLSTGAGNRTRFENLKKYTERDRAVSALWAPHPGAIQNDRFAWLPTTLAVRRTALYHAAPVLTKLGKLDAVMFHAFDAYVIGALRRLVSECPALVWSQDDPPTSDATFWQPYGLTTRPRWRARARFLVDAWCAKRVDLFLPFSRWVGEELVRSCQVAPERVHPLNVGVDLEIWRMGEKPACPVPKILFVGADFVRKGGDLLLRVFRERFLGRAVVEIVSPEAPNDLPPGVFAHRKFAPNDAGLRELYASASILVLPTRGDLVPNVILEGMASGTAVIASRLAGIPDLVAHGETGFLVEKNDGTGLGAALESLLKNRTLAERMGRAGRARVEREFDAAVNVSRILDLMKQAADTARSRARSPKPEGRVTPWA